jgi:SAM-dependent methyltransferase
VNYQLNDDPRYMSGIGKTGIWHRDIASDHHTPTPEPIMNEIKRIMPTGVPIADLGCGLGYTCRSLSEAGFDVIGYEGTSDLEDLGVFAPIHEQDLTIPFWIQDQRNIICLEVGEHIPIEYEDIVFDNITNNAKWRVILSWAIPDQGGTGHFNEQPNYHVIAKMQKRGFVINADLTRVLRSVTPDETWWFRNTIMVFDR